MISFTSSKLKQTDSSSVKPLLEISTIEFNTLDRKKWVERLQNVSVTVRFSCIDVSKKERKFVQDQITLGGLISPYHTQPKFTLNKWFDFPTANSITKDSECISWRTTIELVGIELKENESIVLGTVDRAHISKRIDDWKKRINDLYLKLNDWLPGDFTNQSGTPVRMYEEMMQKFNLNSIDLPTTDIVHKRRIVISFKPKGLWVIGANGRIDVISNKGSYMIVDFADQFADSDWYIYNSNKTSKKKFTQNEFLRILKEV